jgi:hypothetical protein
MENLNSLEFDKAIIVEIFNSPLRTRALAAKYKCTTGEIARIKGKAEPYAEIIKDYSKQMARFLFRREYGYDPISKSTAPPWGKKESKVQDPSAGELFQRKSA